MKARRDVCSEFLARNPTRREALRAGGLVLSGLGLPGLFRSRAMASPADASAVRPNGFGRAKSCILIFQWGGPSQLETLDLKPEAPPRSGANSGRSPRRPPGFSSPSISRCWPSRPTGWRSSGR